MRRAIQTHPAGTWPHLEAIATATLDFDHRNRRRIRLTDDAGEAFLLDLPKAAVLRDGDGLALDGGGYIRIAEAPEPVADAAADTPAATARLAWHLGNRHLPVQILDSGAVRFRADSVIEAMVEGLGARVLRHEAGFTPEPGAYAEQSGHGHGHHHDHDHGHDHAHPHDHGAAGVKR
ncbi:MAG: urease accessory protein UreE [Alphaproteobacteria bacterium]|nr:urease accessory protein UreE [Alphaproteobacteria bacterium]MBO6864386.1 urease accessory protein UreE [Alphaproteobacteria bacterium]